MSCSVQSGGLQRVLTGAKGHSSSDRCSITNSAGSLTAGKRISSKPPLNAPLRTSETMRASLGRSTRLTHAVSVPKPPSMRAYTAWQRSLSVQPSSSAQGRAHAPASRQMPSAHSSPRSHASPGPAASEAEPHTSASGSRSSLIAVSSAVHTSEPHSQSSLHGSPSREPSPPSHATRHSTTNHVSQRMSAG